MGSADNATAMRGCGYQRSTRARINDLTLQIGDEQVATPSVGNICLGLVAVPLLDPLERALVFGERPARESGGEERERGEQPESGGDEASVDLLHGGGASGFDGPVDRVELGDRSDPVWDQALLHQRG